MLLLRGLRGFVLEEAMKKEHLLFDLDGTLTDPKVGITKSVSHALSSFGIQVEDLDVLCRFIGPPLRDSFMEFYGFSEEQAAKAQAVYREYFSDRGIFENRVYDGMEEALKELKAQGRKLYVASSKPEEFVRKILMHFRLDSYFTYMGGSDFEGVRADKAAVIRYVLEENRIFDLSGAVMIGDRKHDVLGARETGLLSVGVLYGYGDAGELSGAGANYLAESVPELCRLLKSL